MKQMKHIVSIGPKKSEIREDFASQWLIQAYSASFVSLISMPNTFDTDL